MSLAVIGADHWCPAKYFSCFDKALDMKLLEGVPLKNDLN
jgi:hypothetical protein